MCPFLTSFVFILQLFTEGEGVEPSLPWGRYQLAVTKYKETEKRSSSMYASFDGDGEPIVNFQKFIDDDEVLTDQVTFSLILDMFDSCLHKVYLIS